jgi:hypothetical protein
MTSSYPCLTNNPINSSNFSFRTQSNVVPFVGLETLDGTSICNGELARFKANTNGGGVEPLFQWRINQIPQGLATTNDIFTSVTLQDDDTVSVTMISSLTCASPQIVNSNEIVMQVNPAPTVTVSTNSGNSTCQGGSITFTAQAQNAGTSPSYQWRRNGQNIAGATTPTYIINSLSPADNNVNVDVVLTTTINCNEPVDVSNPINITVATSIAPVVNIKSKQGFPICRGSDVIFEIDQINISDPNATYIWKVNGNAVANSNSATFNAGVLQNGQTVQLQYTTTLSCANPKTVNSNTLTVNTQALNEPTNLTTSALGVSQINLTWQDNTANETRFRIERSIGNDANFQFLNTVGSNVTFFSDQNVSSQTAYFYRVSALNDNIPGCSSEPSLVVGAVTGSGEIVTALPPDALLKEEMTLFPNPSNNGLYQLHCLLQGEGEVKFEVYNPMQKEVMSQKIYKKFTEEDIFLDFSSLSVGIYYLKITYQDKVYLKKMIRN